MLRAVAPHWFAFDEFAAQHRALQFHALRQKRIGVPQARNSLEQRALRWGQKGHRASLRNVAQALLPAASALLPTLISFPLSCPPTGVETSLDTAGTSACATSLCHKCTSRIHLLYTPCPSTPHPASRKLLPGRSLAPAVDG